VQSYLRLIALVLSFAFFASAYTNCSNTGMQLSKSQSLGSTSITTVPTPTALQGQNAVSLIMGAGSTNQISVSVTICVPGTTTCQTVNNLLLDTGSTGVRIFASALSNVYSSLPKTGLGNCTSYADNSYDWGPMVLADVELGQELASSVPIQVIDNSYGDGSTACVRGIKAYDAAEHLNVTPTTQTATTGFNGLVGVNFLAQDCGSYCVTHNDADLYYSCTGTTCTGSTAALNVQITNPVSKMNYDNNGVTMYFPPTTATGLNSLYGQMYLGIGTQPNNTPNSSVKTLTADSNESDSNFSMFYTTWQGTQIAGFIDSGSACNFFPSTSGSLAEDSYGDYNTVTGLTATQMGYNGVQSVVKFNVASVNSSNVQPYCAASLGSSFASSDFDWGFPFFVGRTVYVGMEGATSSLGTGLYWAY
jgi:hypothetical protein